MVSKIELTERLRAEGRWGEASRFKDTAVKEFRASGMKRSEAADAAWEAMEKAYPPLPVEDDDDEEEAFDEWDDDDRDDGLDDDLPPDDECDDDLPQAESWAATIPWKNLPAAATLEEEVYWAHNQYWLVGQGGWAMASEPPPSLAACKLAVWAAGNPVGMATLLAWVTCNEPGFIERARATEAEIEAEEEAPEDADAACPASGDG